MKIRPLTGPQGVGFSSFEQLPQYASSYREENVGRYWNYHVTTSNQAWPEPLALNPDEKFVIDGFAPNLNKSLHIGHLRQLATANSLKRILSGKAEFVALLGASQGVYKYATDALQEWFNFVHYNPTLYYDVLMPHDLVEYRIEKDEASAYYKCGVWDGPKGPVLVVRTDGRPLYSFYDLAFAKLVKPTHYITGVEQTEHFANLGLNFLPMGLVLGADGKKLKSRDNTDMSVKAESVIQEVMAKFDDTCTEKRKLAWNVLAWNFLTVARNQNVKYTPDEWTKTESPGMYITYTYARIKKALGGTRCMFEPYRMKAHNNKFIMTDSTPEKTYEEAAKNWSDANPDPAYDLTQADADLIGFANYYIHYWNRSIESMDSTQLATYAHDLARRLGKAYHTEKIQGGRYGFQYAVSFANNALHLVMGKLGMFPLEQV